MEGFEAKLSQATSPESRDLLGAIGLVVDRQGNSLYHFASGYQSLSPDAPRINHNSTFTLGSAGKFITNIAALQCVGRGQIALDEPVYSFLPELQGLEVISRNEGPDASSKPFLLSRPHNKITLRHLLTHSSGLDYESNSLIQEWRESCGQALKDDWHPILDYDLEKPHVQAEPYSTPLAFEPGEGWLYGASIEWTAYLVFKITGVPLAKYVHNHIFAPLGMTSSAYLPQKYPEIYSRIFPMVMRQESGLIPIEFAVRELVSSVPDLGALLSDLISTSSKLLSSELQALLFEPQFGLSSPAISFLRMDTETYAAPAGIPSSVTEAPVNHSLAALVVGEKLPLSHMPAGTVTWNGMPNLIWAMHREKGIGMIFATQLLPVDDPKTVDLAMEFFKGAWDLLSQGLD